MACARKLGCFSGGDLAQPYFERQPCYSKRGYGLPAVYPRATNPALQYACVYLDDSNPPLTYFDDGPSIPLVADALENLVLSGVLVPPTAATDISSIITTGLPVGLATIGTILGDISPGALFAATSARAVFWGGGRAHDYCYHNTVHYPGFDKDHCDAMVYKRWALACLETYASDVFQIIEDVAEGNFPGEPLIGCEVLAFLYYIALRTTNEAQQAYLASNSDVHSPQFSDIPDGSGDSFGNRAPDPSLIRQNAELINSTIYTDSNGKSRANLTHYSALLLSSPLIPSPAPPPVPFPPGYTISPSPSPSPSPPTTPPPFVPLVPTPVPTAPSSVAPTPVPSVAPVGPPTTLPSPSPVPSPFSPLPSPLPSPVASPTPAPSASASTPTAVPVEVIPPVTPWNLTSCELSNSDPSFGGLSHFATYRDHSKPFTNRLSQTLRQFPDSGTSAASSKPNLKAPNTLAADVSAHSDPSEARQRQKARACASAKTCASTSPQANQRQKARASASAKTCASTSPQASEGSATPQATTSPQASQSKADAQTQATGSQATCTQAQASAASVNTSP